MGMTLGGYETGRPLTDKEGAQLVAAQRSLCAGCGGTLADESGDLPAVSCDSWYTARRLVRRSWFDPLDGLEVGHPSCVSDLWAQDHPGLRWASAEAIAHQRELGALVMHAHD